VEAETLTTEIQTGVARGGAGIQPSPSPPP
jgi:hypothetical protein